MTRRDLIALLGTTATAWPLGAPAQQQPERVRRIGVLTPIPAQHSDARTRHAAFLQALQQLGWTDGRNVRIDARWTAGDAATTGKYATELAALAPDVIVATGGAGAAAMLQATRTVPIVFVTFVS
jgi:putative ABC transport system substrate-binding protein